MINPLHDAAMCKRLWQLFTVALRRFCQAPLLKDRKDSYMTSFKSVQHTLDFTRKVKTRLFS